VGKELQGDIHFVIVDQSYVDQITEMVNRAGFKVEDVTLNIFAASKSLLTEEDTKMGVAVIDIGEGSTDIIIFKNDKMIYTQSIPLGGMHYLSDLSYISKKSKVESFEILTKLIKKDIVVEESKKYIYYGNDEKIEYSAVKNIIDARTGDVINFITGAIEESGFKGYLGKGLVFTGGTIGVEEVIEGIANKMTYQVRKSFIKPIVGIEEIKPGMSTAIGMFLEILKNKTDKEKEIPKKIKTEIEIQKPEETIEEKKEEEIFIIDENILKESVESKPEEKKKSKFSFIKEIFSNFNFM
jgi:cell division protein FtsA